MTERNVPECIGIIMDGNRRWAKARGRPVFEGHAKGYERLKDVMRWARGAGVAHVVAYAFSTENWNRPEAEVGYLLALLRSILEHETEELIAERVRIRFVGDRSRFAKELRALMERMEAATAEAYEVTLHLLLSYGGRAEIVAAANACIAGGQEVSEESFAAKLWTNDAPDPDLVIRTGGEKRLSNFLPYQTVYSELFFIDTFWPDFSKEEFDAILAEYAGRERRHGR